MVKKSITLIIMFLFLLSYGNIGISPYKSYSIQSSKSVLFIGYDVEDYLVFSKIMKAINVSVDYLSPSDVQETDLVTHDLIVIGLLKQSLWDYMDVSGDEFQLFKAANKSLLFIGVSGFILRYLSDLSLGLTYPSASDGRLYIPNETSLSLYSYPFNLDTSKGYLELYNPPAPGEGVLASIGEFFYDPARGELYISRREASKGILLGITDDLDEADDPYSTSIST